MPDTMHYLQKELYDQIQGSEIFDFLQQGALDGVWYWDLENLEHEWMSPEFWHTFGYDHRTKKHLASEWQDMIHPDDLAAAMLRAEQHMADPSVPYDQYVRYTHANGSTVWVRCRGIAIRDDNGKALRMLGVHQDVTALKQAEQAAAAVTALQASNAHLARFAYVVSHDLKAPLRGIRTTVDWLATDLGDALTPEVQETLDFLKSRAERLSLMIEGVLAYSRIDGAVHPVDLDVGVVVQQVLDVLDIPPTMTIECADLPPVIYDATALSRVFLNLISNAIDYNGPGPGKIRISGQVRGEYVVFEIDDNGPGIPVTHRARAFQMFTTLQSRDDFESTGMGLAISRAIVEHQGGSMAFHTSPLGGCCVRFSVPIASS